MKQIRVMQFENISTDDMVIEGYATVFEEPTVLYEYEGMEYKEIIKREAFDNASFKDCVLKYNHSDNTLPLARTRGGSLDINVDSKGLWFKANIFDTAFARDVYKLVQEGALDKCSFAFTMDDYDYDTKTRLRTITEIKRVFDVSIVTNPAYDGTSVSARNFFEAEAEKERLDNLKKLEIARAKYYYGGLK